MCRAYDIWYVLICTPHESYVCSHIYDHLKFKYRVTLKGKGFVVHQVLGFSSKVEESYFKLIIWVEYVVITIDQRGVSTKIKNHVYKSSAKKKCITVLIFLLCFSQSLPPWHI